MFWFCSGQIRLGPVLRSQCHRHVALGTGVCQVSHSEVLGGQQESTHLLKSGWFDYLQHLL